MTAAGRTEPVEPAAIKGSCCCGAVRFELSSEPDMMATCHCSRCRKLGIATFVFVKHASFRLLQGAEAVAEYNGGPEFSYTRCFCKHCGTALGEITSSEKSFPIAANCIDSPLAIRMRFHEFVDSKPDWYKICDQARQFAQHPVRP